MLSADAWLKIFCSMIISSVLFGFGAVAVLSVPNLNQIAKYLIPTVVLLSFASAPVAAYYIAPRMRVRNWTKLGWQEGDALSG